MKTMPKSSLPQKLRVVGTTAMLSLLGQPVHAATSFPDHPLLTGGNSIPPNIMLILDDSGSMERSWMWPDKDTSSGTADTVTDRSYVNNSLYYNPAKTYLPWRTASTDLSVRLLAADFPLVSNSATSPTGSKIDLTLSSNELGTYFYVPKVANPGTTASNYDKYRITASSSSTSYNGGVVQKRVGSTSTSGTFSSIPARGWSACTAVAVTGDDVVTITVRGDRADRAFVYAYSSSDCLSGEYGYVDGDSSPKSLAVTPNSAATSIYFRVYNDRRRDSITNLAWTATQESWSDMTPSGNTSALQQAELQNFANWYQYHRTRNKMAKAGASEAFGRLGKSYRVGYDTIWNRNASGNSIDTSGSVPAYPIPYATNGGLFEGANRTDFYSRLHGTGAEGLTPLKGALQRAARYYGTDDPWKTDSNGDMLSCRQNYAILTTDGYWNNDSGYSSVGNADRSSAKDVDGNSPQYPDGYSDTLADVAYRYWSTDLRTSMDNNVLTSAADPADWQHMVTFGISIGLQGTLNPNNPPPSPWTVDPTTGGEGPKRIDDLWHAALNGRGKFVVASDSDRFASALIDALATIDSRSASGSNIASSSTKTDTSTLTFVAGFTSKDWTGDLIASPFNAALTGLSDDELWTLSKTFAAGGVNQSSFKSRTVLTSKGGTAALFDSGMSGASDFAARTGQADEVSAADNIAYLKGDQSKESNKTNGTLRTRPYPIGDIVDSSPAYVGDTKTVYIGANDGMMHGIDATNGKVLFSYVPKGIDFAAMASLSATDYEHRYFVDGQIDVTSRALQGNGKNILIGALGRGGRGVFALDVTNPTSMGTSNVLWDNTTRDAAAELDMGYVLGGIRIRNGNGGKTYAFVPNGIDSPNGSATLFVYELNANGGIASTTKLVADSSGGNGLMSLGMADLNGDGKLDTVYGGDLKGNVWRWDFSGVTPPTTAVKLFQAKDADGNPQPITGGIGVGRDTSGTIFLGFGTGRFISSNDVPGVATQTTQSLYGLIDSNSLITGRGQLQERTIPFSGTSDTGAKLRGFENYSVLTAGKQGWYIDLAVPERVISAPTISGSAMYLSSVIPATGSDCEGVTGSGYLNAINLFTGTSPPTGSSYLSDVGTVKDSKGNTGTVGSVGVSTGMPTEVNVTDMLATVGTGAFSSDGDGNTDSKKIPPPGGGVPSRINWREVLPK